MAKDLRTRDVPICIADDLIDNQISYGSRWMSFLFYLFCVT